MFDTMPEPSIDCFNWAWRDCDSMDATGVENILNSIDASGHSAPSSSKYITIDHDVAATPSAATAITNLKSRGWIVRLNGVTQ